RLEDRLRPERERQRRHLRDGRERHEPGRRHEHARLRRRQAGMVAGRITDRVLGPAARRGHPAARGVRDERRRLEPTTPHRRERRHRPPPDLAAADRVGRLCDDLPVAGQVGELIDEGRAAVRVGDGAGARRAFELALAESPTTGEVIEGLARAAYLELDFARAIEDWERAYPAYRQVGGPVGAGRGAREVEHMYGAVVGDAAVMNGWIARAQTLLSEAGESAEAGWVSLNKGMFEGDRSLREELLGNALEIARRFGDRDLEFVALAYLGASIVHDDRTDEGMALLDEALAAVAGGEVDDFSALGGIFCPLFFACADAPDVPPADQCARVGAANSRGPKPPSL